MDSSTLAVRLEQHAEDHDTALQHFSSKVMVRKRVSIGRRQHESLLYYDRTVNSISHIAKAKVATKDNSPDLHAQQGIKAM